MKISSLGIDLEDGVSLPLSFLQGANAFNQVLFVNTQARRTVDSERGFWVEGVFKADGLLSYKNKNDVATTYQAFASSGTFTVPAGVTAVRVLICGAGGSSGNNTSIPPNPDGTGGGTNPGGPGGYGGIVYAQVPTTPGANMTVTVGAAVTNGAGGSSTFSDYTATGGARGGNGGGVGADGDGNGPAVIFRGNAGDWLGLFPTYFDHRILTTYDSYNMYQKRTQANVQTVDTTAIAWSFAGSFCPGAKGGAGNQRAGVGGAVIVFWS